MVNTDGNLDALNRHLHEQEEYDARTIPCPQCDGEGVCAYDEAVTDFVNGGYLKEVIDTCDMCCGDGQIDAPEIDEMEIEE